MDEQQAPLAAVLEAHRLLLDYMLTHNFPDDDIAQAAEHVRQAEQALTEQRQQNEAAKHAFTDALNALSAEIRKQNDFAQQVTAIPLDRAERAITNMIYGEIIRVGYRGRTPPPPKLTRWQRLRRQLLRFTH